jgi:hypothetical protein
MPDKDYQILGSNTLLWEYGESGTKTITFLTVDDVERESDETIVLQLFNVMGNARTIEPKQVILTIKDNESPLPPPPPQIGQLQFSTTNYTVVESEGSFNLTLDRVDGDEGQISITMNTKEGTAKARTDYGQPTEQTLIWQEGEVGEKTFTLPIVNDELQEGIETFTLHFSGGESLDIPNSIEVTLIDDDPVTITETVIETVEVTVFIEKVIYKPLPRLATVQFSNAINKVNENQEVAKIIIKAIGSYQGDISVRYGTWDEVTANSGSDYKHTEGWLHWFDGDVSPQIIEIPIIDDDIAEGNEVFSVKLLEVKGNAELNPTRSQIDLVIKDDDEPEIVQLTSPTCPSEEKEDSPILNSLGEGKGIDIDEQPIWTDANFSGGISIEDKCFQITSIITGSENLEIKGEITVDSEHVGMKADILIGALYTPDVPESVSEFYVLDTNGKPQLWEGEIANLVAAYENVKLKSTHSVNFAEIYKGSLPVGELKIYFGYRLQENGLIIFNGELPIQVVVKE